MWRDARPRPLGQRRDPVARGAAVILGDRDVVRRDGGRDRDAATARSARRSSPRRPTCTPATAASCPRSPLARHLELIAPGHRDALDEAGVDARRRRRGSRCTRARAWSARCSSALSAAKALAWRAGSRSSPSTTSRATSRRCTSSPSRSSRRSSCLLASGGHTMLLAVRDHGRLRRARARRSTTPPARRSTRARGCSASATRAGRRSTSWPAGAIPRHSPSRSPASPVWTSRSPASRRRSYTPSATSRDDELEARDADLAASYQRAIVQALVGATACRCGANRAADLAVVGGVAANSRARAQRCPAPASRRWPLCTDNAAMIASAARFARPLLSPGYLALDAYASA